MHALLCALLAQKRAMVKYTRKISYYNWTGLVNYANVYEVKETNPPTKGNTMKNETTTTATAMTAQETAMFLLENKKWNTMYAKNSPRIIELVKEEAYEMYVDARAKDFDAFKDAAAAEAFCEAVSKAYTATNNTRFIETVNHPKQLAFQARAIAIKVLEETLSGENTVTCLDIIESYLELEKHIDKTTSLGWHDFDLTTTIKVMRETIDAKNTVTIFEIVEALEQLKA